MTCPRPYGNYWLHWAKIPTWEQLNTFSTGLLFFFHGLDRGRMSMLLFLRRVPDSLCFLVIAFPLHPEGSRFPLQGWHMKTQARTGSPHWLDTAEGKAVSMGRHPEGLWTHGWQSEIKDTLRTGMSLPSLLPGTGVDPRNSGQVCLVGSVDKHVWWLLLFLQLKAWFPNLSTMDTLGQIIPCCRWPSVHCRMQWYPWSLPTGCQ